MKLLKLGELPNFFRQRYQVIVSEAQLREYKVVRTILLATKQPNPALCSLCPQLLLNAQSFQFIYKRLLVNKDQFQV